MSPDKLRIMSSGAIEAGGEKCRGNWIMFNNSKKISSLVTHDIFDGFLMVAFFANTSLLNCYL
jgi:hypothetical protein